MVKEYKWLSVGGLLPVLTPFTLLETLRDMDARESPGYVLCDY